MSDADFEARVADLLAAGKTDDAAEVALRQLGPSVLGYLRAVVNDTDDADDAFARFAETLWSSLGGFRRECSVRTWTHRIAWQAARRVLQDPYRRRRIPLGSSSAANIAAEIRSTSSLEREATAPTRAARLRAELTPEEHTMVILRFDRGFSWSEVAEALAADGESVDEATLRKRFERLKKRLRELAVDEGLLP